MSELSPLQNMLGQLTELYHLIIDSQHKKLEITPEIQEAVSYLAKEIAELSEITEQEMRRLGVTKEAIEKTIYGPKDQLPPELRDLLKKSQQLKCQLEGCQNVVKEIMKKQEAEEKLKKSAGVKRQNKFKNIGGKKGWMPL